MQSKGSMNRKLYIRKNKEGSNGDQRNGISSQGFSFPNSILGVLIKTEQARICFRANIFTVISPNCELGIYVH